MKKCYPVVEMREAHDVNSAMYTVVEFCPCDSGRLSRAIFPHASLTSGDIEPCVFGASSKNANLSARFHLHNFVRQEDEFEAEFPVT